MKGLVLSVTCGVGAVAGPAFAGTVAMQLNSIFNPGNGTPPASAASWGIATFEDSGANTVLLSLAADFEVAGEFISTWYFNFDPDTNVNGLAFAGLPTGWSVSTGVDAFTAPGDGKFDIKFDLPTANVATRLDDFNSWQMTITGNGITAQSFNVLSEPGQGQQPFGFLHAAHIQGLPNNNSVHATGNLIPLPTAAGMGLVGFLVVGSIRRRRD